MMMIARCKCVFGGAMKLIIRAPETRNPCTITSSAAAIRNPRIIHGKAAAQPGQSFE